LNPFSTEQKIRPLALEIAKRSTVPNEIYFTIVKHLSLILAP
jgi:hypothetical protein